MTAPRLVFVHGSGGGRRTFQEQLRRFEGAYAPTLPGHPDGTPCSRADHYAQVVSAEIATLPGPLVLVGHSLGGAVALEVALARPESIAGLVLVATGARLPVPDHAFARLLQDLDGECDRVARASLVYEEPSEVWRIASQMVEAGYATLHADYTACAAFDARERLADIDMPTLVIAGAEDPLTPPWLAEELAAGIPDATLRVLPAASHAVMVDRERTFDLLLAGFLARLEVGTAGGG